MEFTPLSASAHTTWPAVFAPPTSMRLSALFQLEQSQWWTADALQRAQFRQLQALVPHAARHVPHYSDKLRGFTDAAKVTPERWAAIPILTRKQLQQDQQRIRSRQPPPEHGRVRSNSTSGSTGVAVEFLSSEMTDFFWNVFCLREHFWHRRDFTKKLMAVRYPAGKDAVEPAPRRGQQWGAATQQVVITGPSVSYDVRLDVAHLVQHLIAEQPAYLLGHASVLGGMIDHSEQTGVKPQGLLELRSIGEMMPAKLRERARAVWGVPVVDLYSCQEMGYLAVQCPQHAHYHVQSENVLLEVLHEDGRPCAPGESGRVIVTSLHNFATPLIRYEVGDYAELGEPCTCGRGLPVLRRILGRHRNLLTLPSGERRWPKMGYEGLRAVVPLDLMQLVQHSVDDIEVRLVSPPLPAEQLAALTAYIHHNLGHPFRLRFEYVADIRNQKNGKIEQFISMLPTA